MDARQILWRGAGRPTPTEYDGCLVPHAVPPEGCVCARCGAELDARAYVWGEVFSENHWPVRTAGQLFGHGGSLFCAACTWSVRALSLRCAPWIAREDGVWFVGRRQLLACLLDPPEPPFVAGWPRYGGDHGGEAHAWRAVFRGADPVNGAERLSRLQAKHCAPYAQTAHSRIRYPLQVDDVASVMVDVPLWALLRDRLTSIAVELRAAGLGTMSTRDAITSLRAPQAMPLRLLARWPALVRGLDTHAHSMWWGVLCSLLPIPDAPTGPTHAPPTIVVPYEPSRHADAAERRQLTLF